MISVTVVINVDLPDEDTASAYVEDELDRWPTDLDHIQDFYVVESCKHDQE